jgi:hypothetical protein
MTIAKKPIIDTNVITFISLYDNIIETIVLYLLFFL